MEWKIFIQKKAQKYKEAVIPLLLKKRKHHHLRILWLIKRETIQAIKLK